MKFALGQSAPRVEDLRLLRGGGRYTDDINLPGQALSFMLRSPVAHANIRSIDTSAALAGPGVIAVYTGADVAELGGTPCFAPNLVPLMRPDGSPLYEPVRAMLERSRNRGSRRGGRRRG